LLIGTSSDNDVARFEVSLVSDESITVGFRRPAKAQYLNASPERRLDLCGIAVDELKNFLLGRKTVRVAPDISATRQLDTPVWKLEHERIPSLRAPTLRDSSAFEDDVLEATLSEVIAHGEACLATTNHYGLDVFHGIGGDLNSEWDTSFKRVAEARRAPNVSS
jgi:hypothetical protein